jgi:hypothetical protein
MEDEIFRVVKDTDRDMYLLYFKRSGQYIPSCYLLHVEDLSDTPSVLHVIYEISVHLMDDIEK